MKRLVLALLLLGALVVNADVYDEQEALANTLSNTLTEHFGQNVTLEKDNWDELKPRWITEFLLETGGSEPYKFQVRKKYDYLNAFSITRTDNGIEISYTMPSCPDAQPGETPPPCVSPTKLYEFEFHCLKADYDFQVWAYTDWLNYTEIMPLFNITTQACLDFQALPLVNEPEPSPTPEPTVEPTAEPEEPDCEGHELGETWPYGDDCNECICTGEGIECTELYCEPTPEPTEEPTIEPTEEPTQEPTIQPKDEEEEGGPFLWIAGLAILAGGAAIAYYEFKD